MNYHEETVLGILAMFPFGNKNKFIQVYRAIDGILTICRGTREMKPFPFNIGSSLQLENRQCSCRKSGQEASFEKTERESREFDEAICQVVAPRCYLQ